jgi:hypothetical protein
VDDTAEPHVRAYRTELRHVGREHQERVDHQLLFSNLEAIAGFAAAGQLALALGVPAVVDVAFPVVRRKTEDQLLLQEHWLEMATNATLPDKDL